MVTLAFLSPLVIGIESYGLYASLYAIPGFFHGSLETYLIRSLNFNSKDFFSNFIIYLILAIIFIVLINIFFFNNTMIIYSILLFFGLIFRSFFYSIVTQKTNKLNYVIYSEWVVSFIYVVILLFAYLNGYKSYLIPLLMVVFSSFISGLFLAYYSKSFFKKISCSLPKSSNYKDLFGRLYEDLFITTTPLVIFNFFGARESGIFRILISILKAIFKFFPYKYEVLFIALQNKSFNKKRFINFVSLFTFFSIVITALLFSISKFILIEYFTYFVLCLLVSGVVIGLLVIYPAININLKSVSITLFSFIILCLISSFSSEIFFSISFCIISIILFYIFIKKIN